MDKGDLETGGIDKNGITVSRFKSGCHFYHSPKRLLFDTLFSSIEIETPCLLLRAYKGNHGKTPVHHHHITAISQNSRDFPADIISEHCDTLRQQHSTMLDRIDPSSRPSQPEEGGLVHPSADIQKQKQPRERKRGRPLQLEHLTPE